MSMNSTSEAHSTQKSNRSLPAAPLSLDESREDEGYCWVENGREHVSPNSVEPQQKNNRPPRSLFSFSPSKSKWSECQSRFEGSKKTAETKMKIIGTTKDPSNEKPTLKSSSTTKDNKTNTRKSKCQIDQSKKTGKPEVFSYKTDETAHRTAPSSASHSVSKGMNFAMKCLQSPTTS